LSVIEGGVDGLAEFEQLQFQESADAERFQGVFTGRGHEEPGVVALHAFGEGEDGAQRGAGKGEHLGETEDDLTA